MNTATLLNLIWDLWGTLAVSGQALFFAWWVWSKLTNRKDETMKGHALERISARGGIVAGCSCGVTHSNPKNRNGLWPSYNDLDMRGAHQRHVYQMQQEAKAARK